jgi:bifunctional N-acetylglucosamine-1-phosphate-uridyltransferase/glucosamine-1-phosphate-acetyltransferase GlmU-like protein
VAMKIQVIMITEGTDDTLIRQMVLGKSVMAWTLEAARALQTEEAPLVIAGWEEMAQRPEGVLCAYDAGAVLEALQTDCTHVLLLSADMPLIQNETLARLKRDSDVVRVEDRPVCLIRRELLDGDETCLRQGVLGVMDTLLERGAVIRSIHVPEEEALRVTDAKSYARCAKALRLRINERHLSFGVSLLDPEATYIDDTVCIGKNTVIYPGNVLEGGTSIGEDCVIYPDCRLKDTLVGDGTTIEKTVAVEARIGSRCLIGPFAYLRPSTELADRVKIGDFVEVKNTRVEEGSKVPHLTYIGDGHIGKNCNLGCGTIFVNYDGYDKFRTELGDNVFIGCNANLVAPVKIHDGAYIAAGSTITEDVPADALAIGRGRQVNKDGWAKRHRDTHVKPEVTK